MSMWEPFTERARQSIVYAQHEAQYFRDGYIAPHHILLGMLRNEAGPVADVLRRYGVTVEFAHEQLPKPSTPQAVPQEMIFTPRAKRAIELAFESARQLNQHYVGPEHLFAGILRTEDPSVTSILSAANVPLDSIESEVFAAASAHPEPQGELPPRADDLSLVDYTVAAQAKVLTEILAKRADGEALDKRLRHILRDLHRTISEIATREGWPLD
jgi:ATP-dependent Clp protease ATP-binding subunit ClpA